MTYLTCGLIHYWPLDGHLNDVVGNAHMQIIQNGALTTDKNNNPNSSLYLNKGFSEIPPDSYFSGDFTFTGWIKLAESLRYARFFDFFSNSLEENRDNTLLSFWEKRIYFAIYQNGNEYPLVYNVTFDVNKWIHLGVTLKDNHTIIYVDGNVTARGNLVKPMVFKRTFSYFGKSSVVADPNLNGILDEIKIFNRALNASEIIQDMKNVFTKA